ncbi:hypothetical protein BpHYR1_005990 [Brachionus plicatilis]|uniref:Uncharacterized protein n=1 Tax=Brachionus plicatilis TaxID=10195 RepID=A0A3M7SWP1_BRAPC|nr:hypothetical protein BpHYR1_005990 [Brachionus plicatilis]
MFIKKKFFFGAKKKKKNYFLLVSAQKILVAYLFLTDVTLDPVDDLGRKERFVVGRVKHRILSALNDQRFAVRLAHVSAQKVLVTKRLVAVLAKRLAGQHVRLKVAQRLQLVLVHFVHAEKVGILEKLAAYVARNVGLGGADLLGERRVGTGRWDGRRLVLVGDRLVLDRTCRVGGGRRRVIQQQKGVDEHGESGGGLHRLDRVV